jgi:hypothetical protein
MLPFWAAFIISRFTFTVFTVEILKANAELKATFPYRKINIIPALNIGPQLSSSLHRE